MALAAATRFDAERRGGRLTALAPIEPIRMMVASTDDVLRPEVDDGVLEPMVGGAITEQRSSDRPVLLARESFAIEIEGPPGSSVTLESGNPDHLVQVDIDAGGIVKVTVE